MSTRQSAIINGLIAENIGKNDLVRSADSRASEAELRAKKSEYAASDLSYQNALLEAEKKKLQEENKMFRELLSRPMREIAEVSGDFRKAYFEQQQLLAEWIMGQKAYKETAMQLGMALEMTPDQVQSVAAPNYTAVLENRTQHSNNSTTNPLLAEHAANILALRKKNGKA